MRTSERAAKLVIRRETASADRIAKVTADEQRVLALVPAPGKFRTLVIDPAWEYDWLSLAGRAKPGYAMQTLDQLRVPLGGGLSARCVPRARFEKGA